MILPSPRQGASSSASGTRVVLPAPGGATSARLGCGVKRGVELGQNVVDRQAIGKGADQAGLRERGPLQMRDGGGWWQGRRAGGLGYLNCSELAIVAAVILLEAWANRSAHAQGYPLTDLGGFSVSDAINDAGQVVGKFVP